MVGRGRLAALLMRGQTIVLFMDTVNRGLNSSLFFSNVSIVMEHSLIIVWGAGN